jgi:hypothetical protein
MALTKATLRSTIRSLLQDQVSSTWSGSALDVIIGSTIDELWSDIFTHAPWFRTSTETLAASNVAADGSIALSLLSKRFFKLKKLVRINQQYGAVSPQDNLLASDSTQVTAQPFSFYITDGKVFISPIDRASTVTITYSYLPTAFTTLADSALIDGWPDGFENAITFEVLARLQSDPQRMANFHAIAQGSFDKLLSRVKREDGSPARMNTDDDTIEWGSV